MGKLMMERIRENFVAIKMKNTLVILDNYLERAVKDELNIVEVLEHILAEEAGSKRKKGLRNASPIDKNQIDELAAIRFLKNGENVVFPGPSASARPISPWPLILVS